MDMNEKRTENEDSNMNETEGLPRPPGGVKTWAGIFSVLCTAIILISVLGMSGVVKAEEEVVEQSGGMLAQLYPDVRDLTYTTAEVEYLNRFDSETSDMDLGDNSMIEDSKLKVRESRTNIEPDDGSLNDTEMMTYNTRFKVDEQSSESAGFFRISNDGHAYETARVQLQNGYRLIIIYGNSTTTRNTVRLHDFNENNTFGKWFRMSVTLGDGTIDAGLYYDNGTLDNSISIDDWYYSVETMNMLSFGWSATKTADFDYVYTTTEDVPTDTSSIVNYKPITSDFERMDIWNPEHKESADTEIDYRNMYYKGNTGLESTQDALSIDVSDLSTTTNVQEINSQDALEYMMQTPENYSDDDTPSTYDGTSHWMSWNNLEEEIEGNFLKFIKRMHNLEDTDDIEIIDYYIDDLRVVSKYQEDIREQIREAYADSLLSVAEENEWKIWSRSLANESVQDNMMSPFEDFEDTDWYNEKMDDGWRKHDEYGDSGWFTVGELVESDMLSSVKINGNKRYAEPSGAEMWKDSYVNTKYSVGGVEVGSEADPLLSLTEDQRGEIKQDIIDGYYAIDTGDSVDDITDYYTHITSKMYDMSIVHFSLYQNTVSDVEQMWESGFLSSADYDKDQYVTETRHWQATNLALASALRGVIYTEDEEYVTMADYTDTEWDNEHLMEVSLSSIQENFTDERADRDIFSFENADIGKLGNVPLTIGTTHPETTYTNVVIVVIIVAIVAISAIVWRKGKESQRLNSIKRK